jgi:glyoxylase-like metal-dependent hydrolase (beta-lactamase superfamily II)
MGAWREVGDRVFVRRHAFVDENVGAIVGDDGVLLVDTRSSHRQADEIRTELREITRLPVTRVVDTHHHWDHCFGNAAFRPAPIWGHEKCAAAIRVSGEAQRSYVLERHPDMADELREVEVLPPDHTFTERATVEWGGRSVELRYLGRGHTDGDTVVVVPQAGDDVASPPGAEVLFAGDLFENGAAPWFGDAYPLDWPATADRVVELMGDVIVPGHGAVGDRAFASAQAADIRAIASLARLVHAGEVGLEDAIGRGPFAAAAMREPLERALAQLRGQLEYREAGQAGDQTCRPYRVGQAGAQPGWHALSAIVILMAPAPRGWRLLLRSRAAFSVGNKPA